VEKRTPSAPAEVPSRSGSSAGLIALDDLSTTAAGTASWAKSVPYTPSVDLTQVVFGSPFSKRKFGIGQFQG